MRADYRAALRSEALCGVVKIADNVKDHIEADRGAISAVLAHAAESFKNAATLLHTLEQL
jgi:hypothetical protein